jgi:hypothetical protein
MPHEPECFEKPDPRSGDKCGVDAPGEPFPWPPCNGGLDHCEMCPKGYFNEKPGQTSCNCTAAGAELSWICLKADIESLPVNATKTYKLASNFVMPTECAHYPGEPGKCAIASQEYTINVGAIAWHRVPDSYPSITIIGDGKLVLDALLRDNPDPGAYNFLYNYNFFHLWAGTLALHGITFKNGASSSPYPGGAIYARSGGTVRLLSITECVFIACVGWSYSGYGGGAISFNEIVRKTERNEIAQSAKRNEIIASTLIITRSTFTGNVAKAYNATDGVDGQGGAIVITNFFANGISPIINITDSVFINNIAFGNPSSPSGPSGTGGAIIYVIYDGPKIVSTITGCTFRNNTADGGGGGAIAVQPGSATGTDGGTIDMNITGCTFRNNSATTRNGVGGAICSVGVSAAMDIANSSFTNNTACAVFAVGGTAVVFTKSNFSKNTSPGVGGAINLQGLVPVSFAECIFETNVAGDCGGAIYYAGPPYTIPMTDCTFIEPKNTSAGHNDIALPESNTTSVTFYCPEGTAGKPAVITPSAPSACGPKSTIPVADLPPSKTAVHCKPSPKTCTGHPPACNCTGASASLSITDCTAWQKVFDAMFEPEPWTTCSRLDPCRCDGVPVACENGTTITFFGYDTAAGYPTAKGLLPSEIGLLTNLKTLLYAGTGASAVGTIPTEIRQLSHLESLDLRGGFIGTIPSEIAQLNKLTNLSLSSNLLTGRVPELPFAQYTGGCTIQPTKYCPDGNKFTCPLPAHAEQCTYGKNGLAGVECYIPGRPPISCSLDYNMTEIGFASPSCSGTPTYNYTTASGACVSYPGSTSGRDCCNHDGSIVSSSYFSDQFCCSTNSAGNQTSGKCKKLSDTSSQLYTCVKTQP